MSTQDWTVDIHIDEDTDRTHAHAVLRAGDGMTLAADGHARRNPVDASVPEIGEELATARALTMLAGSLMDVAARDIESLAHAAR